VATQAIVGKGGSGRLIKNSRRNVIDRRKWGKQQGWIEEEHVQRIARPRFKPCVRQNGDKQ
jgi:hypothetical protein